jgi:hypothetical protein
VRATLPVSPRAAALTPDVPLLASLYVLELAGLLLVMAAHKGAAPAFILLPIGAGLAFVVSALVIAHRYRTRSAHEPRRLAFTVVLNIVPLLLVLAVGELGVRLSARQTPRGPEVLGTHLLPWRWADVVVQNKAILARAAREGSYLVADEHLGWVVGPNRRSADGLYFSSAEGLRSPSPGVALRERAGPRRIALVGDSFTFGLEVGYTDTWGHHLEQALGPDVQVLNFGVDGYGVDQAYLRYARDARPWRPDVVILGLINHDLFRSLAVYSFVSFPGWPFPFAKPRFVLDGERLSLLNVPLPSPSSILAAPSITELPFIEYDPGYQAEDWRWHVLDSSYLYRLLVSRWRTWSGPDRRRADARVIELNRAIVRAFVNEASAAGSRPLLVYFPSDRDFRRRAEQAGWESLAQTVLRGSGLPYTDLTPCLATQDPAQLFGPGHYSSRGNAAVATCLSDTVRGLLAAAPNP